MTGGLPCNNEGGGWGVGGGGKGRWCQLPFKSANPPKHQTLSLNARQFLLLGADLARDPPNSEPPVLRKGFYIPEETNNMSSPLFSFERLESQDPLGRNFQSNQGIRKLQGLHPITIMCVAFYNPLVDTLVTSASTDSPIFPYV